jgi:hypothetical protein
MINYKVYILILVMIQLIHSKCNLLKRIRRFTEFLKMKLNRDRQNIGTCSMLSQFVKRITDLVSIVQINLLTNSRKVGCLMISWELNNRDHKLIRNKAD